METEKFYIGSIREKEVAEIVCKILKDRHFDFTFEVREWIVDDYHSIFCNPKSGHCSPEVLQHVTNDQISVTEIVLRTISIQSEKAYWQKVSGAFLTQEKWCACEAQAPENWIDVTGTGSDGNWFNQCECGLNRKGHSHCNICGGLVGTY